MIHRALRALPILGVLAMGVSAEPNLKIRLNQAGWYPEATKRIYVGVDSLPGPDSFRVVRLPSNDTVLRGALEGPKSWPRGDEYVRKGVLTSLRDTGTYRVVVPGLGTSAAFSIRHNAYDDLVRAAVKSYWFQRSSYELPEAFAGKWARKAGHPDTSVIVHNSAASEARPAGTIIRSPGGWYDAGDYNKYIVNSGITMWTLLKAYQRNAPYFDTLKIGIPEEGNGVPGIIHEILWNLRWMLTMQDPSDGGVYHKLTSPGFSASIMPEKDLSKRYVVAKNAPATLAFAAVTAYAARVLPQWEAQLPGLADSCRKASLLAWQWARKYPDSLYIQSALRNPVISTGEYAGMTGGVEWASAELYLTTGIDSFLTVMPRNGQIAAPWWGGVSSLGKMSLLQKWENRPSDSLLTLIDTAFTSLVQKRAITQSKDAMDVLISNPFNWGSNSGLANIALVQLENQFLRKDSSQVVFAQNTLDYMLGRNGVGVSFVTGVGEVSANFPHHRPSDADTVFQAIPGFLVGGPNNGMEDGCDYGDPEPPAAKAWLDDWCSYASNEVAINWNAPLVYLAASLASRQAVPVAHPVGIKPMTGVKADVRAWIQGNALMVSGQSVASASQLELLDVHGKRLAVQSGNGASAQALQRPTVRGIYFVRLLHKNGQNIQSVIVP